MIENGSYKGCRYKRRADYLFIDPDATFDNTLYIADKKLSQSFTCHDIMADGT